MVALTGPARRWRDLDLDDGLLVMSRRDLAARGIGSAVIRMHLRARRWQMLGRPVVLHNGPVSRAQREHAALISCGPRAALTSFTAMTRWGLTGWDRGEIHVLVPVGTRRPVFAGLVMHRSVEWSAADIAPLRRLHRPAAALVLATQGLPAVRHACALLAAGVQQRLVVASALHAALAPLPKLRHHRALRLAVHDIEQGAQALSEIDFVGLCRRFRLPPPTLQAVRREPSGRRRYLDALWERSDGSVLAVEVDGAIHLAALSWIADQLRQNEVVIGGTPVLRFPSVLVRSEQVVVADQLRRALLVR
jgi:hypothetical protein